MSTEKSKRNWTATEEKGIGKWVPITLLTILLAIFVYVFIVYVFPKDQPKTFVVSISVTEYGGVLPEPAYPTWEISEEQFMRGGIEPWVSLKPNMPSVRDAIGQSFQAIDEELAARKMHPRDTVIVYLRGHSIAHQGKLYFLAGEFEKSDILSLGETVTDVDGAESSGEPSSGILRGGIPFDQILSDLQKLKAENVILLADICDLTTAPSIGVIANNVPELIENSVGQLPGEKALWVITAAASLQPAHASDLRQRTLLQSACEYACKSESGKKGDSYVSLARFYEAVLRYGHHVTQKRQTPLLFRSGTAGRLMNSGANVSAWRKAEQVHLARLAIKKIDTEELEKLNAEEKTASGNAATTTLVSFTQDEKADGASSPEGSSDSSEGDAPKATPVATSRALRFWQLHDQLLSRQNPGGWSPIDFAADQWREMELEAVRLERMTRMTSQGESGLQRLISELEALDAAMQTGASQSNSRNLDLLNAWNSLMNELTPASGKFPWVDPTVIPAKEQASWQPIRDSYRTYFDTMSELPKWLNDGLRSESDDRNRTIQTLNILVRSLRSIDGKLPDKDLATALERPLNASDLSAAREELRELDRLLNQEFRDTLLQLTSASKRIDWSVERAVQQLLQGTNLSFHDRQQLITAFELLPEDTLRQPGDGSGEQVDMTLSIPDMLSAASSGGAQLHFAGWASIFKDALLLAGYTTPEAPRGDSPSDLNSWGLSLIENSRKLATTSNPAVRWKRAVLNDLELFGSTDPTGLIVSVSKDSTMQVSIPASLQLSQLPMPLSCTLKRRNGAPVDRCYLKWEVMNAAEFPRSTQLLTAYAPGSGELEPGQVHALSVAGGQATIDFKSDLELSSKGEVIKISVAIAERPDAAFDNGQTVSISPQNPDRVELYAKCLGALADEPKLIWSVPNSENGQPVLQELSVPAIGKAKSTYELYLANLSDKDKLVQATIYAVKSSKTAGDGRVRADSMNLTRRDLQKLPKQFISSAPILLPRNQQGIGQLGNSEPSNGKKVSLVPATAAPAGEEGESAGPLPIGEFGLLCVLQEVVVDAESGQTRPLAKPPSFHWIDCIPVNPVGKLVTVKPPAKEGTFILPVEMRPDKWNRWQIEELTIEARLTDDAGIDLLGSGRRSAVLKPDEEPARITLSPSQLPLQPIVAHLDVGGFPRAANFQSRLRGGSDVPSGASQPFVWLDQEQLVCETLDGKPIPIQTLENVGSVIPARQNVDDNGDGSEISISKITVPFQVDFPFNNQRSTALISLEGVNSETYESDRQFRPRFELDTGNLTFSAAMEDLVHEISLLSFQVTGRHALKVAVSGAPQSAKSFDIIFDQLPPRAMPVNIDSTRLYLDDSIELSIAAVDDSKVRNVYFAIDRDTSGQGEYDPQDDVHLPAKPFGGQWIATLKASAIKEDFRVGPYSIVCRSVDFAGNIQDKNKPSRFQWTGVKRPVSEPKKEPVASKAAGTPPPPPPPTKHTVLVEITVGGKKPAYPEKTSISGITGASEHNSGGNWIVTKVDEGDYEITASYVDAFGVKYEGKGKLKVTANSGSRVTVDVSRVK